MRLASFVFISTLASWAACVDASAIECDGYLCAAGTVCEIAGVRCATPGDLVVPGTIMLAPTDCGTTETAALEFANLTEDSFSFEVESGIDLVAVAPRSGTIAPGAVQALTLTVDATGAELTSGELAGLISIVATSEQGIRPLSTLVTVQLRGADVVSDTQALDFIVGVGDSGIPQEVVLANHGNSSVMVNLSPREGTYLSIPGESDIQLAPGESRPFEVSFTGDLVGPQSDAILLSYAGTVCKPPPRELPVTGTVTGQSLFASTGVLDFGASGCPSPLSTRPVTITNRFAEAQTVSFSLSQGSGFSFTNSVVVAAGGAATVDIARTAIAVPSVPGPVSAKLSFTGSPTTETGEIDLKHSVNAAAIAVNGDSVDFGSRTAPTSATVTRIVTNNGTEAATVQISPASFVLPGNGNIVVVPSNFTLAANASTMVEFRLETGQTGGYVTNGLTATVNAPGQCNAPTEFEINLIVAGGVGF